MQIADELRTRGHDVTIVTAMSGPPETVSDFRLKVLLPTAKRLGARAMRQFNRAVKAELDSGGYDVSLSVTTSCAATVVQPRSGTMRETLARNVAIRKPGWAQTRKRLGHALSPKKRVMLSLEAATMRDPTVRRFLAVSGYVAKQLREQYAIDDDRIEVLANAAAMPQVDAATKAQWRAEVRQGFGIPDDAVGYLFAAHNPKLKGLDTLLSATRRIVEQGGGIKPVVMLAGRIGYGYQHAAASMGIRDHVRFIGSTTDMPTLFAAADVTVHPTWYDPSSKVVIESLMMGTPAISTSYNGASDFLAGDQGQVRGLVIDDPADDAALASAMVQLADPTFREACREAAVGLDEALSMKRHVDRLEAVLAEVAR